MLRDQIMRITQLTAHSSQLTAHSSQLTAHSSQLTAHSSQLTAHSSQLTAHSLANYTRNNLYRPPNNSGLSSMRQKQQPREINSFLYNIL